MLFWVLYTHVCAHRSPRFHDMESESFAGGTEVDILRSVIGKRPTDKGSATAVGVIFHRSAGILPKTKEVDTNCCSSLQRRMVGIVSIGHHLLW